MCLFPQAFRLIFCLEFFKNCRAVCLVQSIESVLVEKNQGSIATTPNNSPSSFPFNKICKLLRDFIRTLKHRGVLPSSVYSDDCVIFRQIQADRAAELCQELM